MNDRAQGEGNSPVRAEATLREQVLRMLRSEIVAGRAVPGDVYSAPSLAQRLGVSTTPVREALLELSRQGLLEPMRNRGFRVIEPTLDDLNNLFDIREALEIDAAVRTAKQTRLDLSPLWPLTEAVADAVEAGDVNAYLDSDREFHRCFVDLLGNSLLTSLVMSLRDQMRLYGIASEAGLARQRASVQEHRELLRLVETQDAQAIEPLMRRHIGSWRSIFAANLKN